MKCKALGEVVREGLSGTVDACQVEPVVILRHGKPAAMLVGVEGKGLDQIAVLNLDRIFRLEESEPLEDVARELGVTLPPTRKPPARSAIAKPKRKTRAGKTTRKQ